MNKIKITLLVTLLIVLFSCKNTNKETLTKTTEDNIKTETKEDSDQPKIEFPDLNTTSNPLELKRIVKKVVKQINDTKLKKKLTFITQYNVPETPLTIWYENNLPIKIECGAANDGGEITDFVNYYLKDGKLWYVDAIFANFLFENGKLKYWLNENWERNNIPKTDFNNRERLLNSEMKKLITELDDETIFFDEQKLEWRDNYGKCNTCTFENGFNPNGWLLTEKEMTFVPKVLEAQKKKINVNLSWNKITSQLDGILAEAKAEYQDK